MESHRAEQILREVSLKATTSGGKGGQHVNKVATRVELFFDVSSSAALNDDEKKLVNAKLSNRISSDGILRIVCSEKRSQSENKELARYKFIELIKKALTTQKKRTATHSTKASVEERLRKKKLISEKKQLRGRLDF